MDYPVWLDATLSGGVVIGAVSILHVIIAHFAIGAGFVIVAAEARGRSRGEEVFVRFAERHSYLLLLLSVVLGALTGVGIWFTIGLVSPVATSSLIHNFVWGWAIEWVFFILEIAAALIYYNTWGKLSGRTHLMVGWLYFIAAWMSLAVINGIVAFMMTPGGWIESGSFWQGFFNPTYLSSLFFRSAIALILGVVWGLAVINRMKEHGAEERQGVTRWLGILGVIGVAAAALGTLWWAGAVPETASDLFRGPGGLYAGTWKLSWIALAVTGGLLLLVTFLPRTNFLGTAILLILATALFFGGWERVREASRKPWVIHGYMYSNGIRADEIEELDREGILSRAPWAWYRRDGTRAQMGEAVYRAQCQACHTTEGYNSITRLVEGLDHYTLDGLLMALDQNPAMPPFAGTEQERMQLARYLATLGGMPPQDEQPGGGLR